MYNNLLLSNLIKNYKIIKLYMSIFLNYLISPVRRFRLPTGITVFGVGGLSYNIYQAKKSARLSQQRHAEQLNALREHHEQTNQALQALSQENLRLRQELERFTEASKNSVNKFIDDNNFLPSMDDIRNFLDYLNSFSITDQIVLMNLLSSLLLLSFLISALFLFYSDYLIERFNIINKYPKVYKILMLRNKIKFLTLKINIFISLILLLNMIFINIYVLI